MSTYRRANTDWLAASALGVTVHWTAQTVPRQGTPLPFNQAVTQFRLPEFIAGVRDSGADYVIFTLTHALQMLPCPHPIVDEILPGRTAERDLLGEMAEALNRLGKKLIVYYNHSCNGGGDPHWEQAVGYHAQSKDRLADNLCAIIRWLGERYGERIAGWWFDSSYSLDPGGPYNAVSTDMQGFQFPWESLTAAAKAGHAERLVTYNAGLSHASGRTYTFLYTEHQDYWAGEMVNLEHPAAARYLDNGLQWHGWTCLDSREWLYHDNRKPPHPPLYSDDELLAFLRICRQHQAPMSFNVIAFQDGTLAEASVQQLHRVSQALRQGGQRLSARTDTNTRNEEKMQP